MEDYIGLITFIAISVLVYIAFLQSGLNEKRLENKKLREQIEKLIKEKNETNYKHLALKNDLAKKETEYKKNLKREQAKNKELKKILTDNEEINRNLEKEVEKYQKLLKQDNDFNKAYNLIKQGKNVFITGGAGTGKSYILRKLREYIPELSGNVTSTTGISAISIEGVTIHSWAGIGKIEHTEKSIGIDYNKQYTPQERAELLNEIASKKARYAKKNIKEKIQNTTILAIDEISMLSNDLFRILNLYFQKIRKSDLPFGGIQIILIGDFCQLPPVIKRDDDSPDKSLHYAFDCQSWKNLQLTTVQLKTFHRQKKDIEFAKILDNLRFGKEIDEAEKYLAECIIDSSNDKDDITHVYQTNDEVKKYNQKCLKKISQDKIEKVAANYFVEPVENNGTVEYRIIPDTEVKDTDYIRVFSNKTEDLIEKDTKAVQNLELKIGCKVMVIKNLEVERGVANGTIGHVIDIQEDFIMVDFDNCKNYQIKREDFIYYDKRTNSYIMRRQFPLILAYAITIHKSQGLTLDKIVVDINDKLSINEGQAYVAFSRVRTKEGLFILNKFPKNKILADKKVSEFYTKIAESGS